MALQFPTRAEQPGHLPHTASLRERTVWPEFLYHDPVLERLFGRVIAEYAEFQFYAWDDEREEVVGGGMAVPAWWDGDAGSLPDGGLDAVVEARFAEGTPEPTALCALQILIAPECRGEGLSSRMIRRMAEIGRDHGLERADRSGPADPEGPVSARSDGAVHQVASPGRDSLRSMAEDARASRSRNREGRAGIDERPRLGRPMGGMG
jgi:GNAT superfamily N-acetyltransferase